MKLHNALFCYVVLQFVILVSAETTYNMTCGAARALVTCNVTSIHCKNGDVWKGGLDQYTFVKNCTELLRFQCYRLSNAMFIIKKVCCIDGINRTIGNYTNELEVYCGGERHPKPSNCTVEPHPFESWPVCDSNTTVLSTVSQTTEITDSRQMDSTSTTFTKITVSSTVSPTPTDSRQMDSTSTTDTALVIGLAAGIVGVIIVVIIVVIILVMCKRRNRKSDSTLDLEMDGIPSNATSNNYDYVTNGVVRNGLQTASTPATTCRTRTTPDYDYIDVDTLDMPQNQTQDTELDNDSMDGPYNTIKAPAVPERQPSVNAATSEVVTEDNDNYEGIGAMGSDKRNPGKSEEVVMVDNAGYEAVGPEQREDKDMSKAGELVMVDNADYEAVGTELKGSGATDVVMVDNADYEAVSGK